MRAVKSLLLSLVLLVLVWHYFSSLHPKPRKARLSFDAQYQLEQPDKVVRENYSYTFTGMKVTTMTRVTASSKAELGLKDYYYSIFPAPDTIVEERLYGKGSATFSVVAEFKDSAIVSMCLQAEAEALAAAECWKTVFMKIHPAAPLESAIKPKLSE